MKKDWHSLPIKSIYQILKTSEKGLTQKEAEKKLVKYGPNKLKEEAKTPPLKIFLSQFKDFLILILLLATIISFLLGETIDAVIILIIVILSAVLGFVQEFRSQKAVEALKKLIAPSASVLRDGQVQKIPSEDIVSGDILVLQVGDKVAADARIIEEIGLGRDWFGT
jgi:Ca2+-transporting ATPase